MWSLVISDTAADPSAMYNVRQLQTGLNNLIWWSDIEVKITNGSGGSN